MKIFNCNATAVAITIEGARHNWVLLLHIAINDNKPIGTQASLIQNDSGYLGGNGNYCGRSGSERHAREYA